MASLSTILSDLRERGYARVVMIHHPPLPGLATPRKALADAPDLREVLETQGAELVLHGHNHEHMLNPLNSRFGTVHVLGVPSASLGTKGHYDLAAWNRYDIVRQGGRWTIQVTVRAWDPDSRHIETVRQFTLST